MADQIKTAFTVAEILTAINTPNYRNGLPGQPVGYPCVAQADVVAGVVCPYLFVQPTNKVILEVLGYIANVPNGGAGQNFIFMMTTLAQLTKVSLAVPLEYGKLALLQSPNPQGLAKSRRLTGEIAGGTPPSPAQYVHRGFFNQTTEHPIHRFPHSIVVHGQSAIPQVAGIMASGPDLTIYPTLYCREWPLDLGDYT